MSVRRFTLLMAVAAAWSLASATPAGAGTACPASVVFFETYTPSAPLPVASLVFDSTFTEVWSARMAFDRAQGTLFLSGASSGRASAAVRVIETFDIIGVPPGTPVSATVQLELDGWAEQGCGGSGCGVRMEGVLRVGADSSMADANLIGPGSPRRYLQTTLQREITLTAGAPTEVQFVLVYGTGPGGGGAVAQCAARYRVTDLPAGVKALACLPDLTPVSPPTWGRLKSIYR